MTLLRIDFDFTNLDGKDAVIREPWFGCSVNTSELDIVDIEYWIESPAISVASDFIWA